MKYLEHLKDELIFIRKELAKNISPRDKKWLDKQEDNILSELINEMIND